MVDLQKIGYSEKSLNLLVNLVVNLVKCHLPIHGHESGVNTHCKRQPSVAGTAASWKTWGPKMSCSLASRTWGNWGRSKTGALVVWNHGILWLSIQLGISSSQLLLTPSFFRGVGQPPTRYATSRQFWWALSKNVLDDPRGCRIGLETLPQSQIWSCLWPARLEQTRRWVNAGWMGDINDFHSGKCSF